LLFIVLIPMIAGGGQFRWVVRRRALFQRLELELLPADGGGNHRFALGYREHGDAPLLIESAFDAARFIGLLNLHPFWWFPRGFQPRAESTAAFPWARKDA
jgi:hypothetical protein